MTHPWRLHELPPEVALERLTRDPRLIVPVGTLHARGPHLPLGCDTLIVEALADVLSARTGVVRAPAVPFGVLSRGDAPASGAASLSRKTLHRVMNELIAAWEDTAGVKEVFVLTAHAAEGHQEALSTIRALGEVRMIDVFSLGFEGVLDGPGPRHGGELDTSLLLFLHPALVTDPTGAAQVGASAAKGQRLLQLMERRILERWFPDRLTERL